MAGRHRCSDVRSGNSTDLMAGLLRRTAVLSDGDRNQRAVAGISGSSDRPESLRWCLVRSEWYSAGTARQPFDLEGFSRVLLSTREMYPGYRMVLKIS